MSKANYHCGCCGKSSATPIHDGCIRRLERRHRKLDRKAAELRAATARAEQIVKGLKP